MDMDDVNEMFCEMFKLAQIIFKKGKMPKEHFTKKFNIHCETPEQFWSQLLVLIGTEEDVQIRRDVNDIYTYALCDKTKTFDYMSGSKGEGFLFPWSDIDIMQSIVRQTISMETFHNKCKLTAKRTGCQTGFCKLLINNKNNEGCLQDFYLSRVEYLQSRLRNNFNKNFDFTNRGPCLSTKYPGEFDRCYAFPIHPDSCVNFLKTFQTKFWNDVKSRIIVEKITVMHCVPKGPEKGDEDGYQWLISCSVLEQLIVRSLNHVQFCCYGLMKIILHSFIDICTDTHDTLSSYHLKTVLFHVLEDVHQDFWIPQNIFYCIRICLTRLMSFLIRGSCPNYFILENNLFSKSKIIEKKCKVLKRLLEMFLCENSLYSFTVCFYIHKDKLILLSESHKLRIFYSLCSALNVVRGYQTTYRECVHSILKIIHALQLEDGMLRIPILKYIGLLLMRRIGIIMYDKFALTGYKSYLLSAEVALMFALHANVLGSIDLATLWYCQKKYKQCIKLLCSETDNLTISPLIKIVYNESLVAKCTKEHCDYSTLFGQHYFKSMVDMHKTSHLFPEDLRYLVENCNILEFVVYDKSYAYFLLFLIYTDLHKTSESIMMCSKLLESYKELSLHLKDSIIVQNTKKLIEIVWKKLN